MQFNNGKATLRSSNNKNKNCSSASSKHMQSLRQPRNRQNSLKQKQKISTIEIVDEDDELPGDQATVEKASGQIQEGLNNLTVSLQQLQASAEAIETEEKSAKRPRTSSTAANDHAMGTGEEAAPAGEKPPFV